VGLSLVPSAARTASGNSGVLANLKAERLSGGEFHLKVTSAATGSGDTLNVYVQHSVDGGTTWDDFISFTQVLGNGGAKHFIAPWMTDATAPAGMHAAQDAALAAGSIQQGPTGESWRVKWVIAGGGPSFTFELLFNPVPLQRSNG
jgi:hypothetical protein